MSRRIPFAPRWAVSSLLLVTAALLLPSAVGAQQLEELVSTPVPPGEGWQGFTEVDFLLNSFLTLVLAAVLGAIISYHPRRLRTADTLEEIETPKACILYSIIGALIGIMVVKYGTVVGFVLFGIGGLIRFRTVMRSAHVTGQVILVTLIGLSCGLDLPHVAVMTTAFGWVLMFILEARITYQVDVRGLPQDRFAEAAGAYRSVLAQLGYGVVGEKVRPEQSRICFTFRTGQADARQRIEKLVDDGVDPSLRGSLDWEVD